MPIEVTADTSFEIHHDLQPRYGYRRLDNRSSRTDLFAMPNTGPARANVGTVTPILRDELP